MILKPRQPRIQPGHPLDRGLTAAWMLAEGAGKAIYDISGYRADGNSWTGTINWTAGPALGFTAGVNASYISLGTPWSVADLGPVTFAFWIWMSPSGANKGTIFSKTDNNTVNAGVVVGVALPGISSSPGQICFIAEYSSQNKQNRSTAVISTGKWTHVVVSWSGVQSDNASFYIDGFSTSTIQQQLGLGTRGSDASRIAYIGGTVQSFEPDSLDGLLGELRIWRRVLSAGEVLQLFHSNYSEFRPMFTSAVTAISGGGGVIQNSAVSIIG